MNKNPVHPSTAPNKIGKERNLFKSKKAQEIEEQNKKNIFKDEFNTNHKEPLDKYPIQSNENIEKRQNKKSLQRQSTEKGISKEFNNKLFSKTLTTTHQKTPNFSNLTIKTDFTEENHNLNQKKISTSKNSKYPNRPGMKNFEYEYFNHQINIPDVRQSISV